MKKIITFKKLDIIDFFYKIYFSIFHRFILIFNLTKESLLKDEKFSFSNDSDSFQDEEDYNSDSDWERDWEADWEANWKREWEANWESNWEREWERNWEANLDREFKQRFGEDFEDLSEYRFKVFVLKEQIKRLLLRVKMFFQFVFLIVVLFYIIYLFLY